jgi:hypothetical protein
MPRPSPEERKRIETNRAAKRKLRAEIAAREQRTADRVQGIVDTALARARRPLPDLAELIQQLEEARQLAMACFPPQPNAAINATMAQAKLLGFVVDKQAIAVGKPDEFRAVEQEEEILERLRERHGSRIAQRFSEFIRDNAAG